MGPYGSIPGRGALALTGIGVAGLATAGLVTVAIGVVLVIAGAVGVRMAWRRQQAVSSR